MAATESNEDRDQLREALRHPSIESLEKYADWLNGQTDEAVERGNYLKEVLAEWKVGSPSLPSRDDIDTEWQDASAITVLRKLREGELTNVAEKIIPHLRPALILTPKRVSGLPVGSSRLGGLPDLPHDTPWPQRNDMHMVFVGQIQLTDLRDTLVSDQLPSDGLLSFFVYCPEGQAGEPDCPDACRVLHFSADTKLQRHERPRKDDPCGQFHVGKECRVEWKETLDLPYVSYHDAEDRSGQGGQRAADIGIVTSELDDAYEAILECLMPEREEKTHLLGWSHPNCICDDPVDDNFTHLLSVGSEEETEFCWSDGHMLYFSVPSADFKPHRYESAQALDG